MCGTIQKGTKICHLNSSIHCLVSTSSVLVVPTSGEVGYHCGNHLQRVFFFAWGLAFSIIPSALRTREISGDAVGEVREVADMHEVSIA